MFSDYRFETKNVKLKECQIKNWFQFSDHKACRAALSSAFPSSETR